MSSPKKASDQSRRFIDAAREAGCDDDPGAFERVFAKIVPPKKAGDKAPPVPKVSKKP
jgi:hypothetical protein